MNDAKQAAVHVPNLRRKVEEKWMLGRGCRIGEVCLERISACGGLTSPPP
jgi:hypothetical protein